MARRPNRSLLLFAILIGMIVLGNYVMGSAYNQQAAPKTGKIAYSDFKQQVAAGNVKAIIVKGDEVTGTFKQSYTPTDGNGQSYTSFTTLLPSYTDTDLSKLLDSKGVVIGAAPPDDGMLGNILSIGLPMLLMIGFFVFITYQSRQAQSSVFGFSKNKAKVITEERPKVSFDDVAGAEEAKQDLQEIVEFLRDPLKFSRLGGKIPKGVLLMGAPGTGKTLLAKAVAGEAKVPFLSMGGSEFVEMFVGVGASRVRDLFDNAKKGAPSLIFIDEIDAVGRQRGAGLGGGHDEREQTLNQLLSEMDGFDTNQAVVVIAATNRPDVLDPALLRPGRFDRQVVVDVPDRNAREAILKIHTRKIPVGPDVDMNSIARSTPGFTGADLANLANEATLLAARKNKNIVEMIDFEEAKDKILLGAPRTMVITPEEKRLVAYHEAGHALVASILPNSDPVHKVTIVPRGRALGVTMQLPVDDRHNYPKQYLLERIAVALGGRAAERVVFNDVTSGAENDLQVVTTLARKMVGQWGMSDAVGPVSLGLGAEHPFLGREMASQKNFSEETAAVVDQEIKRIVGDGEICAERIMQENRLGLDGLANALLETEVLDATQVRTILEGAGVKIRVDDHSLANA
jgi:cell division protease FtsH